MTYGALLSLPAMLLFAVLYTPAAALILLLGCARLFFDATADWRHARRHTSRPANMAPNQGAECGAPEGVAAMRELGHDR